MRANTQTIIAAPEFSLFPGADGNQWARLRFPTTGACLRFSREHANTENERDWGTNSDWIGLETQSTQDFYETSIAQHSKSLVLKETGKLSDKPSRPGEFRAAITGGYWDVPSVVAGLPLAARSRVRSKLPPKTIRITASMSAGVSAEAMARITAKIAHALWAYTIAGGAATLEVTYVGRITSSTGAKGLAVETRVNASDVAALSAALSPVWFRAVTGRLMTAASEAVRDSICIPRENPIPNSLWIGGVMANAVKAGETVLKELALV